MTVTLQDLSNLQSETTAVNRINANNAAIEAWSAEVVEKTGGTMTGDLDMNSNQIINLPAASSPTEPVRKQEFDDAYSEILAIDPDALTAAAAAAASAAATAADSAATATAEADAARYWAEQAEEIVFGGVTGSAVTVAFSPTGNIAATNVQTAIAELDTEKAALSHTHTIANVTGLQTALDAKLDSSTAASTYVTAVGLAAQLGGYAEIADLDQLVSEDELAAMNLVDTTDLAAYALTADLPDVILASGEITSATATLDLALTGGYKHYKLVLSEGTHSAAGLLTMRISTDNGASYKTGASDYSWSSMYWALAASTITGDNADDAMTMSNMAIGTGASSGLNIATYDITPGSASGYHFGFVGIFSIDTNRGHSHGRYATTGRVTHIRLLPSTGNFTHLRYKLIGCNP